MKRLVYFLLFLLLVLLIILYKCCHKQDYVPPIQLDSHVPNQIVVNFENHPNLPAFTTEVNRLGYRLVAACPCSDKLVLLEDTTGRVRLNPDGEVSTPAGNNGGDGTGVSRNYRFGTQKFGQTDDSLVNYYPQAINPQDNVIASIVDSGVDFDNTALVPHLFQNALGSTYCSPAKPDGRYGINIPFAMGRGASGETIEPKDNEDHGTFINGIVAGKANVKDVSRSNIEQFTGGNENIAIRQLNISFSSPSKEGNLFDALCGIHYALSKGAKIINASWGLVTYNNSFKEMAIFKTTLDELAAPQNDALLIVSAGNDTINFDSDGKGRLAWPAAFSRARVIGSSLFDYHDHVITVGAWNLQNNDIAYFSNRGSLVDIYAPGFNVLSIVRGSNKFANDVSNKGTSFAAPFVTRTAAIMKGKGNALNPKLTAAQIKHLIIGTSQLYTPLTSSGSVQLLRHRQAINAVK
jgi:subtilisin family serine protease